MAYDEESGQLFLLLQTCLLNSHTPLMIVHLAKTNLIYIHSGHKIKSDCFRNMHINSAHLHGTHPPEGIFPPLDYNTWPASNTAPSPGHAAAPYTVSGYGYSLLYSEMLRKRHTDNCSLSPVRPL